MEIDTLETKPLLRKNKSLNASPYTQNLPCLIEKMKHTHSWAKGELNAVVLMKSPNKQVILTALHENTEINSFQSNDSITLQIIEGKLKFQSQEETVTIDKGQLLTFHEKVKYRLSAKEETVFLLTVAT